MNVVIISGNLGRDPELSYTPQTQTACCRMSVAVARKKKDEGPDWFRVTVWGDQGERCHQYLKSGQEVKVLGSLRVNKGKDGKEYTEIIARDVEFGRASNGQNSASEGRNGNYQVNNRPEPNNSPEGNFGGIGAFQYSDDNVPY